MMALLRQDKADKHTGVDSIICYSEQGRKVAFEICEELRRQGLIVETDITEKSLEEIMEYARAKNIGGVISIKMKTPLKYTMSGQRSYTGFK